MASNKTEKPTQERLRKARQQGQFLSARGMLGAMQFITAVVLLGRLIPGWKSRMQISMALLLERGIRGEIGAAEWPVIIRGALLDTLMPIVTMAVTLLLLSVAVHFATTKMGFSMQRLMPKFDRFNPMSRLKGLPSQNLNSVIEAVVLLGVMGITEYMLFKQNADSFLRLPFQSVQAAAAQVGGVLNGMMWKASGVFLLFGSVDLFRQYRKHMSSLRMTKEEIKEENKRNDGDPQIKSRIRRLRRELLRRQMMREVPKATAVIVNPTHFAVAIRYDAQTMSCPTVVAKGKNWLALRIRKIATENQVPIIENPPLARALYDAVEVGRSVSPEFYKAIAEILAYIYRMMGRRPQAAPLN